MTEDDTLWCESILYFWREKGDPERCCGWDRVKCQELMPAFLDAWDRYKSAEDTINRIADSYRREL